MEIFFFFLNEITLISLLNLTLIFNHIKSYIKHKY